MLLDTHIFLWWLFGDSKPEHMPLATVDKALSQFPVEVMMPS